MVFFRRSKVSLFKIIIFGILIINSEVQGEEGFLIIPVEDGSFIVKNIKINKQKLSEAIVSRIYDAQKVHNFSINHFIYTYTSSNPNITDSIISFTIKTSTDVFEDIICKARIKQTIPLLTLLDCKNKQVKFEEKLEIPLENIIDSFYDDKISLIALDPQ